MYTTKSETPLHLNGMIWEEWEDVKILVCISDIVH